MICPYVPKKNIFAPYTLLCQIRRYNILMHQTLQIAVLTFLRHNPDASEQEVANAFFERRVLAARQMLQGFLWAGTIVGDRHRGYRLSPSATAMLALFGG